ncbi:FAD-dependent oxidoreductase [Candidatus Daviesbacteria bacterium]|nr:FAD-dependent oxidoreductase [Candidatus Daviesbacteria bacterium]
MLLKVLDKKSEAKDVFSLIFEKPKSFIFYPGQYLDYELAVNDPNGNTRAFTISSSPTENFLMLVTKKGFSEFKKALIKFKKGDEIKTSHPAGTFILDESTPAVFIAGGIGITPFRSMVKYAADYKLKIPIILIYSNSDENFLFKKELAVWEKNLSNLKIIYHSSGKIEPIVQYVNNAIYYLAGPPKMVKNYEKLLLGLGIDQINIRYDQFDGY